MGLGVQLWMEFKESSNNKTDKRTANIHLIKVGAGVEVSRQWWIKPPRPGQSQFEILRQPLVNRMETAKKLPLPPDQSIARSFVHVACLHTFTNACLAIVPISWQICLENSFYIACSTQPSLLTGQHFLRSRVCHVHLPSFIIIYSMLKSILKHRIISDRCWERDFSGR